MEQIQGPVYNLALRMLWHPEDARDATQDILIRVITHLGSFRGDSRVRTWVYRVAANYLNSARQGRVEAQGYTFERFANDLREGLAEAGDQGEWPADKALLLEEVKVGCMHGLLTCLDRRSSPRVHSGRDSGNGRSRGCERPEYLTGRVSQASVSRS